MKITVNTKGYESGGYATIESDTESLFVKEVNKKLGDYWVSTGRERDILNVILEVLAESYDETHDKKQQ